MKANHGGEVLFTASVGTGCGTELLGSLGALAIIPLVAVVVNLFAGDKLPSELEGSTPWFLGAALLLGAITLWYYFHTRRHIEVRAAPHGVAIWLQGKEIVRSPFDMAYGYQRHKIQRGVPATSALMLGVITDGRCVISIVEEWGAIHGTPDWPQQWPKLPGDKHTKHVKILGTSKFLSRLIAEVERRG